MTDLPKTKEERAWLWLEIQARDPVLAQFLTECRERFSSRLIELTFREPTTDELMVELYGRRDDEIR